MNSKYLPIVIALFCIIFSIPIILPYFHNGYFPTHDGEWAVVRLADMYRELKDYQFPARYSGYLNHGYGYPLFNFAYPLPYYVGIILHGLKLPFVLVIKVLFAISVPLSMYTMYLFTSKLWKNQWAGLISALFYVYYPYRIVDLYVRGSIGESLAFILFPLILYYLLQITEKKSFIPVCLGGLAFGALILTHNIMAIEFLPILFLSIGILSYKNHDTLIKNSMLCMIGLGSSAFFWLPALLEKQYISLSIIPIADRNLYFIRPLQLIMPQWGYGVPTASDGFSYQIGLAHSILYLVAIFILLKTVIKRTKYHAIFITFTSIGIGYIFLFFSISAPLWQNIPLLKEINYPWTLLAPLGVIIATLIGYIFLLSRIYAFFAITCIIAAIVFIIPHARPQYYTMHPDTYYVTNDATTTSSDEYTPIWVKQKPSSRPEKKVIFIKGLGKVSNESFVSNKFTFAADISLESIVQINTIYYHDWKIKVNNSIVPIRYDNPQGLMRITLSKGKYIINGSFYEPPGRLFADSLSAITIGSLVFYLGFHWFLLYKKHA